MKVWKKVEQVNSKYKILGIILGIVWYIGGFGLCGGSGTSSICTVPLFGLFVKLPLILMSPLTGLLWGLIFYLAFIPSGIVFVYFVAKIFEKLAKRYRYFITIPTIFYFICIYFLTDPFSYFIYKNELLNTLIVLTIPLGFAYFYHLYPNHKRNLTILFIGFFIIGVSVVDGYAGMALDSPALCDFVSSEYRKNICYSEIARDTSNPDICDKIKYESDRNRCRETALMWITRP